MLLKLNAGYWIVNEVITALQLASLVLIAGLWSSDLEDGFFMVWSWLRLGEYEGTDFSITFFVVTGVICGLVALSILPSCFGVDFCPGLTEEYMWYIFMELLCCGPLMVPALTVSLESLNCVNGHMVRNPVIQCWRSEHAAYIVLGILSTVTIILGLFAKVAAKMSEKPDSKDFTRYRSGIRLYEFFVSAVKVFVCCGSVFLTSQSLDYKVAMTFFMTLAIFSSLFLTAYETPHVYLIYNYVRTGSLAFVTWIFFCGFISSVDQNSKAAEGLLLVFIAFVPIALVITRVSYHRNLPSEEELFPTEEKADLENLPGPDLLDDPVIQNYCKRLDIGDESVAVFEFKDELSLDDFIYRNHGRTNLAAIFVKGKIHASTRSPEQCMTSNDFKRLKQLVSENKFLKLLSINGQIINSFNRDDIVDLIRSHSSVEILDLFDNMMNSESTNYILKELEGIAALRQVNLGENDLDADSRTLIQEKSSGGKYGFQIKL